MISLRSSKKEREAQVMHAKKFLHELLGNVTHKLRKKVLIEVVIATINIKKLALTAIGRAIDSPIQERSGIQKVNRLLGNTHLLIEQKAIATKISNILINNKK